MSILEELLVKMTLSDITVSIDSMFYFLDATAEAAKDMPDGAYFETLRQYAAVFIDEHKLPFDEYDAVAAWVESRDPNGAWV